MAGFLLFPLMDYSAQDAKLIGKRAEYEMIHAGRATEALKLYQSAYRTVSDPIYQLHYLNNIGACQLALFRYSEAATTLLKARKLAAATHDDMSLGSADTNLAAVYAQMDDLSAGETYAREALNVYSRTASKHYQALAQLNLAWILSRRKLTSEGEAFFKSGIETTTGLNEWASASDGWLLYGRVLLENDHLVDADRAFAESERMLHQSGRLRGEDAILLDRSRLRLRQKDFKSALTLVNSAIEISSSAGGSVWQFYETRAEVELKMGDARAALRDARTALHWARVLRANVIPDNGSRVGIEGLLDRVFAVLIDAGNLVYLRTGERELLKETFEASENNRAESLEELLPASSNWRAKLSTPEYRYTLSKLVQEQRRVLSAKTGENLDRLQRIQAELSQMEAAAGATVHLQTSGILSRVLKNLPENASFLSFRFGEDNSWLWAVDHGELQLYRLPPKADLQMKIRELQETIKANDVSRLGAVGQRLYTDLFGGPDRPYARSTQWYISIDEPLLPFAALVVENGRNRPVYLTERRAFEVVPSAQMFASPQRERLSTKRFLLAGDGIYNHADPRYRHPSLFSLASFDPASWRHSDSWSMARLPQSGAELQFAAALSPRRALLTGASMNKESAAEGD